MADIYNLLEQISSAIYGEDVRGSIHDAIEQCYEDATGNPASLSNLISSLHDLGDVIEMDATTVGPIAPGTGYHFDDDTIYLEPGSWILEFGISVDPSAGTSGSKGILTFASIDPYWNHPDQERYFNYAYEISNTFRHYTFVDEDNPIWDNVIVEEGDNQGKAPVYLYLSNDINGVSINVNLFVRALCLKKQGSDEPGGSIEEQVAQNTADISLLNEEVTDVKSDLNDLQEEIEGGGSGLTADLKAALDQLAQRVAYIDENGQDYYDALHNALYPPANLTSISCVYTQSGTVYDTDTLDSLKSDLVVTATYDDSTSEVVTNYTLSGTLTEGTSTITVSYGGKTATFNVTVTHNVLPLYDWDFTQSLVDSIGNVTAVLTGCTRDSSGVNFTAANQAVQLGSEKIDITDKTYILDFPSMTLTDGGTNHARLLCSDSTNADTGSGAGGFIYRHNFGWTIYTGSVWDASTFNRTTYPIDFFNGKRLKIYIGTDLKLKISYAEIGSDTFTEIGTLSSALQSTYQNGYLVVGGTGNNNFSPVTVSKIKIWEGEV